MSVVEKVVDSRYHYNTDTDLADLNLGIGYPMTLATGSKVSIRYPMTSATDRKVRIESYRHSLWPVTECPRLNY